jgi:very-short-patch-repair endonuclease
LRRKIIPYNPRLKEYARRLRNKSTKSEIKLWLCIKGKQMKGYDFHRQKPLNYYIADFYCYELKLVIELDGESHLSEEVKLKDSKKQKKLESLGLKVLRFKDEEVFEDIGKVLETIEKYIIEFERVNP